MGVQEVLLLVAVAMVMVAVVNAKTDAPDAAQPSVSEGMAPPVWAQKMLLQVTGVRADAVVAQDGTEDFTTVAAAIAAAPQHSLKRHRIHVKKGVYDEILHISHTVSNLTLIGEGMGVTVITGNLSIDHYSMQETATVGVDGPGFMAQDITIQNTAGAEKNQSIALRSSSRLSVVYRCSKKGYQDTLFAQHNFQLYRDCRISGTIDFIYGDAIAVFQNCLLLARLPRHGQQNVMTAQGREAANSTSGFVFQFCNMTGDALLRKKGVETYLRRPWKPYSRTIFMECFMDDIIHPLGYLPWKGSTGLDTLYYGEYNNSGSGANTSGRVKWTGFHIIGAAEAHRFTVASFIDGRSWLPATGVDFVPGL